MSGPRLPSASARARSAPEIGASALKPASAGLCVAMSLRRAYRQATGQTPPPGCRWRGGIKRNRVDRRTPSPPSSATSPDSAASPVSRSSSNRPPSAVQPRRARGPQSAGSARWPPRSAARQAVIGHDRRRGSRGSAHRCIRRPGERVPQRKPQPPVPVACQGDEGTAYLASRSTTAADQSAPSTRSRYPTRLRHGRAVQRLHIDIQQDDLGQPMRGPQLDIAEIDTEPGSVPAMPLLDPVAHPARRSRGARSSPAPVTAMTSDRRDRDAASAPPPSPPARQRFACSSLSRSLEAAPMSCYLAQRQG